MTLSLYPQAYNLSNFVDEYSYLIPKFVPHELSTLNTDMLLAVEVNRNIFRGKTDRTTS